MTIKLEKGQEVTVNVPFTYIIGDEGIYTGKILETIEDLKAEVLAEIDNGILSEGEVFMTIEGETI